MKSLWDSIKKGYLRLIEPVADYLVRRRVNPNVITTIGTLCTIAAAVTYAFGHISIGGWILGLTALFDVLDGTVARRTGRETKFGAFYDSSLDRISDGMILGGLAVFYATDTPRHSVQMVILCLLAIIGTFVTSYTRARADALGIDAKVGMLQRPERVVLLSAPQAFFGLAFNGLVLAIIVSLLAVTSWITAVQRISFVYHATTPRPPRPEALAEHSKSSQSSAGPDGTRAAVHAPSPQP
ncbi:MAG TPA: CDP-alcohol phosphatidyltransferase family protein [Gemmatimonadaceae bacterium]|jgi:CDP-diacylglycerol--glycerol-3-phosphate 3-phosphatidyltransferase|nr:CDP-alcohol phosphatidyltransferase family protein [Gemmatimonadaceae bacterium]